MEKKTAFTGKDRHRGDELAGICGMGERRRKIKKICFSRGDGSDGREVAYITPVTQLSQAVGYWMGYSHQT
jgi:hypothetical protein